MKKSIIILSLLAISSSLSFSQILFENFYFGEHVSIYKGKYFKMREDVSLKSKIFYTDFEEAKKMFNYKVAFPVNKIGTSSKDSLLHYTFIVEDVLSTSGESFSGIVSIKNTPIFVLKDIDSDFTVYFKHEPSYYFDFPFTIGGCDFNCFLPLLDKKLDDFNGKISFETPFRIGKDVLPYKIIKNILKGKTTYYFKLIAKGSTLNVGEKGVYILFEDGSKIEKPNEKVDANAGGGSGWDYSAFMALTPNDLIALKTKKVKKIRLYIYDREFNEFEQNSLMMFARCVSEIK